MAGTVLFVDDESDLRFMVGTYFEHVGIDVMTACDYDEAVQKSTGAQLSAVVLDVNLPGKSSSQLLDFLREKHPATPIILYSGNQSDDDVVKDMLARGAKRHLLKDGSLESLIAAVKELG